MLTKRGQLDKVCHGLLVCTSKCIWHPQYLKWWFRFSKRRYPRALVYSSAVMSWPYSLFYLQVELFWGNVSQPYCTWRPFWSNSFPTQHTLHGKGCWQARVPMLAWWHTDLILFLSRPLNLSLLCSRTAVQLHSLQGLQTPNKLKIIRKVWGLISQSSTVCRAPRQQTAFPQPPCRMTKAVPTSQPTQIVLPHQIQH